MRQAIEALEQQARLARMFSDPSYQSTIQGYLQDRRRYFDEPDVNNFVDTFNTTVLAGKIASLHGVPYWWSPQMCSLLAATYPSMPIITLTRDLLPSPNGFFWFATPVLGGGRMKMQCAMWAIMLDGADPSKPLPSRRDVEASSADELLGIASGIQITMTPDRADDQMLADLAHLGRPTWQVPHITIAWEFGQTQEKLTDDIEANSGEDHLPLMKEIQALAAGFMLLKQRILVSPHGEYLSSQDRKRIERAKPPHHEAIRIVALRKAFNRVSGADRQSGDPVDWSCRWMVGGHWRNQYYPSTNTHAPIYILPYWKGPEDAPIKPPSQLVMSVHR